MGIFSSLKLFKKKVIVSDDEKTSLLQKHLLAIDNAINSIVNAYGVDIRQPKPQLVKGLFLIGAIDSASQAANLDEKQFTTLALSVFRELGYNDDLRNKILGS